MSYTPHRNQSSSSAAGSRARSSMMLDDDESLSPNSSHNNIDVPKSVMAALTTRDPQESFLRNTMNQFEVFPTDVQNRLQIPRPRQSFAAPLDDDETLDRSTSAKSSRAGTSTANNSRAVTHPGEYLAQSDMWRTGDAGMYDGSGSNAGSVSPSRGGGGGGGQSHQDAVVVTSDTQDMLPLEPGVDGHSAGSALFDRAVENFRRNQAAASIAAAARQNNSLHHDFSQSRSDSALRNRDTNDGMSPDRKSFKESSIASMVSPTPGYQHQHNSASVNRFSVTRASTSHATASHTPKHNYSVNKNPDHLSKPEPDYSILDSPSFLRDWGAELSSGQKGANAAHLRVSKLPTDMLLDGQAVGAPPASTAWDANAALNEDVMFEESRQLPELYLADPTSSAAGDLTGFLASVTPNRSMPGTMVAMEGTPEFRKLLEERDQAAKMKEEERNRPQQQEAQAPAQSPRGKKGPQVPGKSPAKLPAGKGKAGPGSPTNAKQPPSKPAPKQVVIPKGPLACDYLSAPSHTASSQDTLQQFLYQSFVEELSRKGQPLPTFKSNIEPTKTVLKPSKHNPFGTGEIWDPFFQLGWFNKAREPQTVVETANVKEYGKNPKTQQPMYQDAFGNVASGLVMVHPMRRWLVDYFLDKGTARNDPITRNIDKWLMDNIKDLFGFEKRLLEKLGQPKSILPLSAQYDVQYPEESGITFTPTKYVTRDEMSADAIQVGNGPIIEVPKPEPVVAAESSAKDESSGKDKKDKKGKDGGKDKKEKDGGSSKKDAAKDKDSGSKDKKEKKEKKEKKDKK